MTPFSPALLSLLFAAAQAAADTPVERMANPEPVMIHALKGASGVSLYFSLTPGTGEAQSVGLSQFTTTNVRKAFEVPDFVVIDPAVTASPSGLGFAYFTLLEKTTAEECRKLGWDISTCPAALEKRTLGFARFNGNGWVVKQPILTAKATGDGTSPYAASAVLHGQEVWLYYITAKRDGAAPGVFRQKFAADGETILGAPERVLFENAAGAANFDHLDVARLKCEGENGALVFSMVASLRAQSGLPFLLSADGLHFRQEADSAVAHNESPLTAGAQLPQTATAADCGNFSSRHSIHRELLYSERKVSGAWAVQHAHVSITVSGNALPGAPDVAEGAAASPEGKCTAAEYLREHPAVALNPNYAQNPMLHFLVFGKDEGACEPSLPPVAR
jgi:hypothetical protein